KPIGFANSTGKTIRIYEASDVNTVVWQADPEPGHAADGKTQITFSDLPNLKPNTTYFALADPGWITIGNRPAGPLNDGAYWYRFRTQAENDKR
ncbi:MAG: arylsulfatase, partial [Rubripirellula sp.]